jgi:hypothetical protein
MANNVESNGHLALTLRPRIPEAATQQPPARQQQSPVRQQNELCHKLRLKAVYKFQPQRRHLWQAQLT